MGVVKTPLFIGCGEVGGLDVVVVEVVVVLPYLGRAITPYPIELRARLGR